MAEFSAGLHTRQEERYVTLRFLLLLGANTVMSSNGAPNHNYGIGIINMSSEGAPTHYYGMGTMNIPEFLPLLQVAPDLPSAQLQQ